MNLFPRGHPARAEAGIRHCPGGTPGWRRIAACVVLFAASAVQGAGFSELTPVAPSPAPPLAERPAGPNLLATLQGKPVVVNFWATWCEPCRDEMPALDRLRGRRPDVVVLTVAMNDSRPQVARFVEDYLLDLPVFQDPEGLQGRAWGVRMLPTTVVLDARHQIRYRAAGPLDWRAPALEALLNGLKTAP